MRTIIDEERRLRACAAHVKEGKLSILHKFLNLHNQSDRVMMINKIEHVMRKFCINFFF